MANLKETAKWETGIRQFEESDPVQGGENGVDNIPTRQLANRTVYLKQEVERAATTKIAGRVKLNSSIDSDSETEAATPKSVKITYDLANEAKNAATKAQNSANKAISTADTAKQTAETTATTKIAGRVKLNSSIDSESETEAATPKAVKTIGDAIQDLANDAVSKAGDTMTGQLKTSKYGIKYQFDNDDAMVTKTIGDNYAFVFFNAETDNRASKLVFNTQSNAWKFQYVADVTINGK